MIIPARGVERLCQAADCGRDEDNPGLARFLEKRDKCVRETSGAGYVRRENLGEALPRGCFGGESVGSDAGVVDEHVEPAVFGGYDRGGGGDGGVGCYVQLERLDGDA